MSKLSRVPLHCRLFLKGIAMPTLTDKPSPQQQSPRDKAKDDARQKNCADERLDPDQGYGRGPQPKK